MCLSSLNLNLSSQFLVVDINPNGRNYASGAEDGYVRLHQFDQSYLDMKDPVPEEGEDDEDDDDDLDDDDENNNKDNDGENAAPAPAASQ
jgi:hypothetical protein